MRAVLLAGGKGTRLYPYTAVFPKPLVPLGDKPIMEIFIRQLKSFGFDHVTICVGHLASLIKTFFKDGKWLGIKIDYSLENEPLGTVGPLALLNDLPETFLVANGDLLTTVDLSEMMKIHKRKGAILTVGIHKQERKIEWGVLEIKRDRIVGYSEKPTQKFYISAGVYILDKSVLKYLPKNKYFDFPQLVNLLIQKEKNIVPYNIRGYWLDIGRPDDYQKALEEFSNRRNIFK